MTSDDLTKNELPNRAGDSPIEVEVEAGKKYAWCSCGLSENQPFCDGKHKGSEFAPIVFEAQESGSMWLCACKKTKNKPACDGSHNR